MCRQSIVFVPVQDAIHQAIEKCDDITGLVGDKALPCCRKLCLHISPSIGNEQRHQQPFQTRFCISVSELLLTELPECRQQVVFFKLLSESIVRHLAAAQAGLSFAFDEIHLLHQHDAHDFFKRAGTRLADCTQQTDKDNLLFFFLHDPFSASIGALSFYKSILL